MKTCKIELQNKRREAIIKRMNTDQPKDKFVKARQRMVDFDLKARGIEDSRVLEIMAKLPREQFMLENYQSQAYTDGPIPIGYGQTISQPYIVALMTQELKPQQDCVVLEIGTGSGYQTSVLSKLFRRVCTIERYNQLSESAQAVLGSLGLSNIEFGIGDGSCGWLQKRQFDRIMVTAAVPKIPKLLAEQLVIGGLIIAPVGQHSVQQLILAEKTPSGLTEKSICDVRFVKLIGEYAFKE